MTGFFDDLERQLRAAALEQARTANPTSRRSWRRPTIVLAVVSAVGIATPGLAAVSGVWDPGGSAGPTPIPAVTTNERARSCDAGARPTTTVTDRPVNSQLLSQLEVLRRPKAADDALPVLFSGRGLALAAVNLDAIRSVGSVGTTRYFVVPSHGAARPRPCGSVVEHRSNGAQVCLLDAHAAGACTTISAFSRRGLTLATQAAGATTVASLVPDGVDAVTIRIADSRRTFSVTDGFFGYRVTTRPQRVPDVITWHRSDGTSRDVPLGG